VNAFSENVARIIDGKCFVERPSGIGWDQIVQIEHDAI